MASRTATVAANSGDDSAPAGTRSFWLVIATLGLTAFLGTLNNMSLGAFLPFIADDLERSVPVLGQISTAVLILGAATSLVVGPLADQYGLRRFLLFGSVTVVVTAAGTALAGSFGMLLAARLVSAFSGGILLGISLSMVAVLFDGQARRKAMSWVFAGGAVAPVLGVPLLTVIGSLTSWRGAFVVLAVAGLVITGLVLLALPGSIAAPQTGAPFHLRGLLDAYRPLLRDRTTLAIYASSFTRAACWLGFLVYLGAFLFDVYGADARAIGWAYMLAGAGFLLGSVVVGEQLKNVGLRTVFGIASAVTAPLFCIALVLPLGLAVSVAFLTIVSALGGATAVGLTTLLADESPGGGATTMGLNSAVRNLGTGAGAALGGALIALGGYPALGLGLSGLLVISTFLIWQPNVLPHQRPVGEP
jgi:MFS transporter, DHA1 family, inner membrane transport protein